MTDPVKPTCSECQNVVADGETLCFDCLVKARDLAASKQTPQVPPTTQSLDEYVRDVAELAKTLWKTKLWKCEHCSRDVNPGVIMCDICTDNAKNVAAAARRQRTLDAIPSHYRWATFDAPELLPRVRPNDPTRDRAKAAIDRTTSFAGEQLVMFQGGPGYGKTSLAVCLLRLAAEQRGVVGFFADSRELAEAQAGHRFGTPTPEIITRAKQAPILLLDELGAERAGATVVGDIVHARDLHDKPVIYTTGFGKDDLVKRYGGGFKRRGFEHAKFVAFRGDAP